MTTNKEPNAQIDDLAVYISMAQHYDSLRCLLEPVVAHCCDHHDGVVALGASFGFALRAITVNGAFISESEARTYMMDWCLKKKSAEMLVAEVYIKLSNETGAAKSDELVTQAYLLLVNKSRAAKKEENNGL